MDAFWTYNVASKEVINIKERNTGVHSTSSPRRFNVQAVSSKEVKTKTSTSLFFISSLISPSLWALVFPQYSNERFHTGLQHIKGLFSQISPTRSTSLITDIFFMDSISSAIVAVIILPSKPTTKDSVAFFCKYSLIVGTLHWPLFISLISVFLSWFSAWRKYLPSVHSAASFKVTTTVPADPVNPEINSLVLK